MQFVFLALMCVFTGIYAVKESVPEKIREGEKVLKLSKNQRVLFSRLFFRSASGLMAILTAVGARTGARRPYYIFVIAALCVSLVSDVLSVISTEKRKYLAASLSLLVAAGIFYICAFYTRASLIWIDAALFALIAAPAAAVLYNRRSLSTISVPVIIYTAVLCFLSAKGISLLFTADKNYVYTILAAAGALLFGISNFMLVLRGNRTKAPGAYYIIPYYSAQALLALSVMM